MRICYFIIALLLAGCATKPAPLTVAAVPPVDNRSCPTIAKELQQVSAEVTKLEPEATKAEASNKELRESLMSKILIWTYLNYDSETVQKFDALKARKNELELILAEKNCPEVRQ